MGHGGKTIARSFAARPPARGRTFPVPKVKRRGYAKDELQPASRTQSGLDQPRFCIAGGAVQRIS